MYTEEEKIKIETLRLQNEPELHSVVSSIKNRNKHKPEPRKIDFEIGDKVVAYWNKTRATVTAKNDDGRYQITTVGKKVIENVRAIQLSPRIVENYDNVTVDDKYKKLSTRRLVKSIIHNPYNKHDYQHNLQVKAELSTRGHYERKFEIKEKKINAKIEKLKERVRWQKKNGKYDTKEIKELNFLKNKKTTYQ